jgi:hypothetical protein
MYDRQTVGTLASACGFAVLAEIAKTPQQYSRVIMAWHDVDDKKYADWCAKQSSTVRDVLNFEKQV